VKDLLLWARISLAKGQCNEKAETEPYGGVQRRVAFAALTTASFGDAGARIARSSRRRSYRPADSQPYRSPQWLWRTD
jgi:hypothetical protein